MELELYRTELGQTNLTKVKTLASGTPAPDPGPAPAAAPSPTPSQGRLDSGTVRHKEGVQGTGEGVQGTGEGGVVPPSLSSWTRGGTGPTHPKYQNFPSGALHRNLSWHS